MSTRDMNLALGIDTGGTYTDAVLLDYSNGQVVATAKALTTRHDLSLGVGSAIQAVFAAAASLDRPCRPIGWSWFRSRRPSPPTR